LQLAGFVVVIVMTVSVSSIVHLVSMGNLWEHFDQLRFVGWLVFSQPVICWFGRFGGWSVRQLGTSWSEDS
jgi:hypothetical protein